ncbi:MAG: hypothetical protein NVSMB12_12770 [Acidimicrobiales bacterium]
MTPTTAALGTSRSTAALLLAAGVGLLAARPLLATDGYPTATLGGLFACLLLAGLGWPRREPARAHDRSVFGVLALGVSAFAVGRILGGGHPPAPALPHILVLNGLAAIAEEAFFRRMAFALLEPAGTAYAIGATAVLFAIVHVTVYGWWVLPIDLAAGLVLGWQRAATGRWWVPAVTHVVANTLVVL